MYIPAGRERVEIVGRQGVFFVLHVDREEGCARVIPLTGQAAGLKIFRFHCSGPTRGIWRRKRVESHGGSPEGKKEGPPLWGGRCEGIVT